MNVKIYSRIVWVTLCVLSVNINAQVSTTGGETTKTEAKDSFVYGDWKRAIEEYTLLLKNDQKNPTYLYRVGIAYLETYTNRKKAIEYLELALKNGCKEKDAPFMLAKAYHKNYEFDKAIEKYNAAIALSTDIALNERAKLYQEMCRMGKKMVEQPLKNIEIKNMGSDINSSGLDYVPYVDEQESALFFSSTRQKGNQGYLAWNGLYTADIFIVKEENGAWQKARSIGGLIGTSHDEHVVGLSPSGSYLFTDFTENTIKGDLQISALQGKQYQKNVSFSEELNLPGTIELSACLNSDETILYFASNRPGGKGGLDIYYSTKLPNGTWSLESNLAAINTPWDDAYPHLLSGDSVLYFASEGHGSMGGYDVFKSTWDSKKNTWASPQNIGYPINDVDDNVHLALNKTGRNGYFSAYRASDTTKGCGELDIYQVTFLDVEQRLSTVVGSLYEEVPIDYNQYQEFVWMSTDSGKTKLRFPLEYKPLTPSKWVEISRDTTVVKSGFKYESLVTLSQNGIEKTYSLSKLPKDHGTHTFITVKSSLIPDPNYKKPAANLPKFKQVPVKEATVKVHHKETGKLYGEYLLSPSSGNFVLALQEDEIFVATIDAPGFNVTKTVFGVAGKASYKDFVIQKFKLVRKEGK